MRDVRISFRLIPFLLCFNPCCVWAADLSVASVTGSAGTSLTTTVSLSNSAGKISALQFDLSYDPVAISVVPTITSAASAAGKSLSSSNPAAGVTRILLVGLNQTALGDGPIVNLALSLVANAGYGSYGLTFSNVSASDANGAVLSLTAANSTVTIPPKAQTITFAPISDIRLDAGPVSLLASASSGLSVIFVSTTQSVCTVAGTFVTLLTGGTCSITATQSGNSSFTAAPTLVRTFTVIIPKPQAITFPPLTTLPLGTLPFTLNPTSDAGLAVTLATSTPATCSVSASLVTLLSTGTCTLTATSPGDATFSAAIPISRSFTIVVAPTCAYTLSGDTSVTSAGGVGNLKISTADSCSWTANSSAGFLTLAAPTTGIGSATLAFTAAANTSPTPRTATLAVNGQTITVTQFGTSCSFALSPLSFDVAPAGGSALVSITASGSACSWTGSSSDGNLVLSAASGTAPSQITATIAPNPGTTVRTLTATVGGQTLTATQSGNNCTFALSSSGANLSAAGGPGSVDVTTQHGCAWSTVTGPGWITLQSGSTGTGSGTLYYSVVSNATTAARSGNLVVAGQSFQLTQAALTCDLSLDTSALVAPFSSTGGTSTLGIDTSSSACPWLATSNAVWLTVTPASGSGPGSVNLTAAPNASGFARSGRVTLGGAAVVVTQSAATCALTFRSSSATVSSAGGNGNVGLISAAGCAWTATSGVPWLSLGSSSGTGSSDVSFAATANTTAAPRTGAITLAGQTFAVTQAAAPCAFILSLAGAQVPAAGTSGGTFALSTPTSGCSASAVSFASWVAASTTFSGQTGTVTYSVAANPSGAPRSGMIRVGGVSFTLTQAAPACSFTLAKGGEAFTQAGGAGTIIATASGRGCIPTFSITQGTFVTLGALSGPTGNVFTMPYTVAPFSSASPGIRVGRISLGTRTFTVKETSW
jgi:Cohesin domain/Putative binding domain, N-terminal/Viral BACON domain